MFLDVDCVQLEVNPLAETPQGKVNCHHFSSELRGSVVDPDPKLFVC
jgi:hypothetical protein